MSKSKAKKREKIQIKRERSIYKYEMKSERSK